MRTRFYKGTNIYHKTNCPQSIENVRQSIDSYVLADRVVPSFKESIPSIIHVKDILKMITGEDFSANETKYIRHLAKEKLFNTTKRTIIQLVEFAEKLKNEHNWEINYDFFEGILTSIVLFPPWSRNVHRSYPNHLIVDATFSEENIRLTSCLKRH